MAAAASLEVLSSLWLQAESIYGLELAVHRNALRQFVPLVAPASGRACGRLLLEVSLEVPLEVADCM